MSEFPERKQIEQERVLQVHREAMHRISKLRSASFDASADYEKEVERATALAAAARLKRVVDLLVSWPAGLRAVDVQRLTLPPLGAYGKLEPQMSSEIELVSFDPKRILELASKDWFTEREIDVLERCVRDWKRPSGMPL